MIKLARIDYIDSNRVTLKIDDNVNCLDCKSRCSDGFLSFIFRKKNQGSLFVALNEKELLNSHLKDDNQFFQSQYKKNDVIGLKFNEGDLFKMSLTLYGLPILIFIIMLFVGYYAFSFLNLNTDLGGVTGLVLGLLLSKSVIHHLQLKLKPKVKFFK